MYQQYFVAVYAHRLQSRCIGYERGIDPGEPAVLSLAQGAQCWRQQAQFTDPGVGQQQFHQAAGSVPGMGQAARRATGQGV